MNQELNGIVSTHIAVDLPKRLKGQKAIKNILKYVAPSVAICVFILVLFVGLNNFSKDIQSVLFVVLVSLMLPLWAVMPLAQLFTSKKYVELNNSAVKHMQMHLSTLAPHLDKDLTEKLNALLRENTVPCAWWETLETRTKGISARLFVQSLPNSATPPQ